MASTTITGAYPAGYALDPTYQSLQIAHSATIGGSGVTTTASQASSITNLGTVHGTANGITLSDGGSIGNGSSSYTSALIEGTNPIVVDKTTATITNAGMIETDTVTTTSNYTYPDSTSHYKNTSNYTTNTSIALEAGGSVSNASTGQIQNGVSVAGATGTVVNNGTIGGPSTGYFYRKDAANGYYTIREGLTTTSSVVLLAGGSVTNGSANNKAAVLGGGISVTGAGTIANSGTVGSTSHDHTYQTAGLAFDSSKYIDDTYASSILLQSGTVTNAATGDLQFGIRLGAGKIVNAGKIEGTEISSYYYSSKRGIIVMTSLVRKYSIYVESGVGTVTNLASGVIANGIELYGSGTVVNYGKVGAPSSSTYYSYSTPAGHTTSNSTATSGVSLRLRNGGSVRNGSASAPGASIVGATGVEFDAAGTITNFGTIQGTSGDAILFKSSGDKLVEEGSGSLVGQVVGAGGTLELGAAGGVGMLSGLGTTLAGFATVLVDAGGTWTLPGTVTLSGVALTNKGKLDIEGTLTNSGATGNAAGATLDIDGDGSIVCSGAFTNAGTLAKTSGTGVSLVRSGTATFSDTGTIDVETGTLELTGAAIAVSGTIEGAGTLDFGAGATTLNAGTALSVANVTIVGKGTHVTIGASFGTSSVIAAAASTELTIAASRTLTLSGAATFLRDTIDGAGRLTTNGTTTATLVTLGGTATWLNNGMLAERGTFTLGDAAGDIATFQNAAGGLFDLVGAVGVATGKAASRFVNQGALLKGDAGISTFAAAIYNTGQIEALAGTFILTQAVTGTGYESIANKAVLELGGSIAAGQTVFFYGGTLKLSAPKTFLGSIRGLDTGDTIDVGSFVATSDTYTANANNTGGTLTLTAGATSENFTLIGSFVQTGFRLAKGKSGDTLVTYVPPKSADTTAASSGPPGDQPHMTDLARVLYDAALGHAPICSASAYVAPVDHAAGAVLAIASASRHG